ncbi:uncharacterized protein LOC124114503 isoform X2 [Haliotis rufescens]|uniref:uncharacterized protein LOC124114503 isoform X2 n=1 Tax=Haliotis rufescens TaxID=6454 RepID=UPI00201F5D25|nr:uncharacterized protein LOC124114503 isoform X2 [Haliotis rufescens]
MDLFIPMCILCILTGHRIQGHNTATDGGVRFEKEQTDVGYALQEGQTAEDDWLQKAQTSTEHVLRHTRTNSTGVLSENETEAASNGTEHSATPLPTKPAPSAKNLQKTCRKISPRHPSRRTTPYYLWIGIFLPEANAFPSLESTKIATNRLSSASISSHVR